MCVNRVLMSEQKSLLTEGQTLKINKGNNRPSALTSGRQLAAACEGNGYTVYLQ